MVAISLSASNDVRKLILRALINFLKEHGCATFNEIYSALSTTINGISKTYLREVLRDLIAQGMIERHADYKRKCIVFKLK